MNLIEELVKIETMSALDQKSNMLFLRNEFLKIFENFRGPFYDYVIFKDENNLWSNLELQTKARDLNFTLVNFWILCNGHADSLGVKKQVEQKVPSP